MYLQDMVTNEYATLKLSKEELHHEIKVLTYRHIAWVTALRYDMRSDKPWETVLNDKGNKEWSTKVHPPEWDSSMEKDIDPYLSEEDKAYILSKNNKQTALLYLQSHHLRRLKESGIV